MFHMKHLKDKKGDFKIMKIIVNKSFGGFNFSEEAQQMICKLKGLNYDKMDFETRNNIFDDYENESIRTDKDAISIVEQLGAKASIEVSKMTVIEIPDDSHYLIDDYDGYETVYYSKSPIEVY